MQFAKGNPKHAVTRFQNLCAHEEMLRLREDVEEHPSVEERHVDGARELGLGQLLRGVCGRATVDPPGINKAK